MPKMGLLLKMWHKGLATEEPIISGGESTGHCSKCGHRWGPDYVWLGAMMQVSPLPGTCSFDEVSSQTRCGCRMNGHFTF